MSEPGAPTGFFGTMFDLSFTHFVTIKLVKFLYVVGLLVGAIGAVIMIGAASRQGAAAAVGALVLAPLGFLLFAMYLRVMLEIMVVMFRIAEDIELIASRTSLAPAPRGT